MCESRFFFGFVRDIFIKYGIASVYPSFMRELDFYEDYFKTHSLLSEEPDKTGNKFQAVIQFNNKNLFSLEWDICRILKDLDNHPLPTVDVPVSCKEIYSDVDALVGTRIKDYRRILNADGVDPILLVWIWFIGRFYIIDGNHRYMAARLNDQETIKAMILPAGYHLKYMLSEESRMRYKIFHNISTMSRIREHPKCSVSDNNIDDKYSLYPISGKEIKVGGLRPCFLLAYRFGYIITHSCKAISRNHSY